MAADRDEGAFLSKGYKRWLIFVLLLVSIFNYADRSILAILAQPIKEDLHLTDTDVGILQGLGFAILYSVLGVPLGWLAERVNRTRLMAACLAAWSVMTAACGLATGFTTLLLGRIGVGIGEAGAQPVSNSLQADHFPPNNLRIRADEFHIQVMAIVDHPIVLCIDHIDFIPHIFALTVHFPVRMHIHLLKK